ncbi:hypothetical protein A0H81_12872 [Grifola frondosa]|uniref:Uncharacterized protein n=1 Tax=Grifola frondosa TaxID=5627 RepID=A0A1C7LST4_GRIFR|nr:hypothetical protein A0H81_12872 [Grifola frondosa]
MAISKGLKFWGMVGGVMTALKLKERWDDYREVPTDEEGLGHGPVALRTPTSMERPPILDCCWTLRFHLRSLSVRGRTAACGLFWKAFGIVCLILAGWQAIRFAMWAVTPKPTGLEGMPEYSTSLGCSDVPHLYNGSEVSWVVPVSVNKQDHSINLRGGAVGTLMIAQGASDATEIKYEMTLRTDDSSLLNDVILHYPTAEEMEDDAESSRVLFTTPFITTSACMRYDLTLFVPPNLKKLHVQVHSVTHVKFDTDSNINLGTLFVTMYGIDKRSMLLPHQGVHADHLALELMSGWLVGDVAIVETTKLTTQRGDAVANVHTTTGAGRTDIFYVNHPGFPHRPISSTHRSSKNGDIYLTYQEAEFNGTVELTAKSFTAIGMQGAMGEPRWVGNKDGGDKMSRLSPDQGISRTPSVPPHQLGPEE